MPKIRMPEQYKGYLSEWDMLIDPTMGIAPTAGITLLGMSKGLRAAGYPKKAIKRFHDLIRKNLGIKKTKEIVKGIPKVETFDKPFRMGGEIFSPEDVLGYHHPFKGVGLRKYGYDPSLSELEELLTPAHEYFGHEAHSRLIKEALKKRGMSEDMATLTAAAKIKLTGKGEDIAEAIAADIMSQERPAWRILHTMPHTLGLSRSVKDLKRISKIRAHAILKKAGKVEKPTQGFLSGNIKARLLLPHLKP